MPNPKYLFSILLLLFIVGRTALAGLTSLDIGQSAIKGSTEISTGTYTIKADGRDIGESWDDFRFVCREIRGDFEAVVRVVSFEPTHEWAKVGLMARQSTDPGSSFAFSLVTPWHGALLQWRLSNDAEVDGSNGDAPVDTPIYLKLVRQGSKFSAFKSLDGQHWEESHASGPNGVTIEMTDPITGRPFFGKRIPRSNDVTIEMKDSILLGLAVMSHISGRLTTAIFDNLTINGVSAISSGEINTADGFNVVSVNRKGMFILTTEVVDIDNQKPLKEIHISLPTELRLSNASASRCVIGNESLGVVSIQEGQVLKAILDKAITTPSKITVAFEVDTGSAEVPSLAFSVRLMTDNDTVLVDKLDGGNVDGDTSNLNDLKGIAIISDAPVIPPKNVNTKPVGGENDVNISWEASDERVKRYEVYADGKKIGETIKTTYTHTCLDPGTTISYRIIGVTAGAWKSDFSESATAVVGQDTTAPQSSDVQVKRIDPECVKLTWKPDSKDAARYVIYRGTSQDDLEQIAVVEPDKTEYVDKTAKHYAYAVDIVDDQGNATVKPLKLSQFYIFGDAYWDKNNRYFVLTNTHRMQAGSIFLVIPYEMREWVADFEIRIWGGEGYGGGADGMTFAFVRRYDYPQPVGGGMGFGGEGYGIEFDTYPFGNESDPEGQHIGLLKDNVNNHLTTTLVPDGFRDDNWHHVRVVFSCGKITVYYDGREAISNYSISDYTVFTGYFGFTAATGESYEYHAVRNVRIAQKLEPIHDVMMSAIIGINEELEPEKPVMPRVKIFNAGSFDEVNVPVSCEITTAGTTVYSNTQTIEKLVSFKAQEISFPEWIPEEGKEYEVTVKLLGDANKDNDSLNLKVKCMTPLEVAISLRDLAYLYQSQAKYSEAESLFKQVLAIREKNLGLEHLDVAESLDDLAYLYQVQWKNLEADPLFQRSLAIYEKVYGSEKPKFADYLHNRAVQFIDYCRYNEAEALLKRARTIYEKTCGPEHFNIAISLYSLSMVYFYQGRYAETELLCRQALAMIEKKYGSEHFMMSWNLYGLALACWMQGKYLEAESAFQRAVALYEKRLGSEHFYVADKLVEMVKLYRDMGKYSEAEASYKRALAIYEKTFGPENDHIAYAMASMASSYSKQGKYSEAEALYKRALAMDEKIRGPEHYANARDLLGLGSIYQVQGKYSEAEPLLKQALAIYEKTEGPENRYVADTLVDLAKSKITLNRPESALSLMQRSLLIDEYLIDNVFFLASEREKFTFLRTIADRFDILQSLVAQNLTTDPEAVRTALDIALRRKGLVLDSLSRERMALLSSSDPKVGEIAKQLQNTASYISTLTLAGTGKLSPEIYKSRLSELETEKERLEKELANLSGAYADGKRASQADADHVAKALESGSVLVEYVGYRMCNFQARNPDEKWGANRYLAFVLPAGQNAKPTLIELGEAETIDKAVQAFRQEAASAATEIPYTGEAEAEQRLARKGARLYELVFAPLKSAIGDSGVLYIAPDGELNLLPFETLIDDNERYLIETYQFNYLSSGRDLLKISPEKPGTKVVVLADPDYNLQYTPPAKLEPVDDQHLVAVRSVDFKTRSWASLPNTRKEAESIVKALSSEQVQIYEGDQASEEVVKGLQSPRILHLATHGFFIETQDKSSWLEKEEEVRPEVRPINPTGSPARQVPDVSGVENPLLRSGLVLAGANRLSQIQKEGMDDGVLTALEISGMWLWGTDLVVLSACETGMGEALCGEGVFGLRRAFQLAGAKTVIMSLWNIPDEETVTLMTDFYTRLKAGMGKSRALHEASLALMKSRRERNGAAHPFFWGAFVCVGRP